MLVIWTVSDWSIFVSSVEGSSLGGIGEDKQVEEGGDMHLESDSPRKRRKKRTSRKNSFAESLIDRGMVNRVYCELEDSIIETYHNILYLETNIQEVSKLHCMTA